MKLNGIDSSRVSRFAFYATVFLVSAAALAYELALLRIFTLIHWHQFAYLIISVALLGFGLSGAWLVMRDPRRAWPWAVAFVVAMPLCAWLAIHVPFNPLNLVWQSVTVGWLAAYVVLLGTPFFCAANFIGMTLLRAGIHVGRVYAANLIGSAVGAGVMMFVTLLFQFPISEYKSLSRILQMPNARVLWEYDHPLGRVTAVTADGLRIMPGLSRAFPGKPPSQQSVLVINGDAVTPQPGGSDYWVEWVPSAAPYWVRLEPRVLVLGVGGGIDVAQAVQSGASQVLGVELHPLLAGVAKVSVSHDVPVGFIVKDARSFVRNGKPYFDIIQLNLLDSAGLIAFSENYLYTVEAFRDYFRVLRPGGVVCITRWIKNPPRDEPRLVATARAAGAQGVAVVRGWATFSLLARRTSFSAGEVEKLQRFCREQQFELDTNPSSTSRSVFDTRPTTDDRPFFNVFFTWRSVPYLMRTMGRDWLPFMEWGYLMLLATLLIAFVFGALIVAVAWRVAKVRNLKPEIRTIIYFSAIGVGFMLLEMAWMQKLTLWLGHPLYGAGAVIAVMLVAAGIGSACLERIAWPHAAALVAFLATASGFFEAGPMMAGVAAVSAFFMGLPFPQGLARLSDTAATHRALAWAVSGCASVVGAVLATLLAVELGFRAVILLGAASYAVAWLANGAGSLRR